MSKNDSETGYLWPSALLLVLIVIALTILIDKSKPAENTTWKPEWQSIASFETPRRALAAVASATHLYVIGGVDNRGNYARDVEYARIASDGSLESWQKTSPIKLGRFYLSAVIVGKYLYVLGGGYGPLGGQNLPTPSVERAVINSDGSLGNWEMISNMQLPRRGLKAVAYAGRIYAIGGYSGVFLKSTEYATVNADGSLSPWTLDPQEANLDRYIHSATLMEDRIFLIGGHVQNSEQMSYGDGEFARINPTGMLNPWQIEPSKLT